MSTRQRWTLAATVLVLAVAAGASAQTVAMLELVAVGNFANPHEITVDVGSTVELAYMASDLENLAFFEDNLTMQGPASPLSLVSGASWWEQQANTLNDTFKEQAPGVYKLLGESGTAGPPFSHSNPGPVSLAVFEFLCQEPGDVVVQALWGPLLAVTDAQTGAPLDPDFQAIGSEFSDGMVTIHQGTAPAEEWILDHAVAPGQDAFGQVTGTDPGTYLDGAAIALLAEATDPMYFFDFWEETLTGQVPGGDPKNPSLEFQIASNVNLVAHFAQIPEPVSFVLLGAGVAGLALRRRR